jgi:hypothetical protein
VEAAVADYVAMLKDQLLGALRDGQLAKEAVFSARHMEKGRSSGLVCRALETLVMFAISWFKSGSRAPKPYVCECQNPIL